MKHDVTLGGCDAEVLAGYLKALAVHRLVAEQVDAGATSRWSDDGQFHLESELDEKGLESFFADEYRPTPIASPWNGGSGFYPKDQKAGIDGIAATTDARFETYRRTLDACREAIEFLGLKEKPDHELKVALLRRLRSNVPDEALAWIDAAVVVGDEPAYPGILGSGGNDGRLEFANNFMQRLVELFSGGKSKRGRGAVGVSELLRAALFGETAAGINRPTVIGQFAPGRVGGANMTTGLDGGGGANPADFVLSLEGALCFAGAAVRRLGAANGGNAFPFHVQCSPVGYGSAADADGGSGAARGELWLPFWSAATSYPELRQLFGEGRLQVLRRTARNGLDAARAVASLGADRGIKRFERMALLRRNGLAYLATSLGYFEVKVAPAVDLLREIDAALLAPQRDDDAPAVRAARRALQVAAFEACRADGRLTSVLEAAGRLEIALARSPKSQAHSRPLPPLSPEWASAADDGSAEFAVARAVASWAVRPLLVPIGDRGQWVSASVVWTGGDPLRDVAEVARWRLRNSSAGEVPLGGSVGVGVPEIAAMLDGHFDRAKCEALLFALAAVRRGDAKPALRLDAGRPPLPAFALLRAVTSPHYLAVDGRHPSPKTILAILARIEACDLAGALEIASRRLRASGRPVRAAIRAVGTPNDVAAWMAALVVPMGKTVEQTLIDRAVAASAASLA